jgi:hypothetical protein
MLCLAQRPSLTAPQFLTFIIASDQIASVHHDLLRSATYVRTRFSAHPELRLY